MPQDTGDLNADRLRTRQERKAERKRRRNAGTGPIVAQMPVRDARQSSPRTSIPVGPIAQRIGRIGSRMIFKQLIRILLSSVLRR